MTTKQTKTTRPLQRLSSDDCFAAREVLTLAAIIGLPDRQTQRKAFIKLIPIIFAVRKLMGITFKQITATVNQFGFKLAASTTRSYYAQFQPQLQKECDAKLLELKSAEEAAKYEDGDRY